MSPTQAQLRGRVYLAAYYLPLVLRSCARFYRSGFDRETMTIYAAAGLIRAIDEHDGRGRLLPRSMRSIRRHLDGTAPVPDERLAADAKVICAVLEGIIAGAFGLTEQEQAVLCLRMGTDAKPGKRPRPFAYREIAAGANCTAVEIRQWESSGMGKIAAALSKVPCSVDGNGCPSAHCVHLDGAGSAGDSGANQAPPSRWAWGRN